MVRPASFDSSGMKKGAWSEDEDNKLRAFILTYGHWNWRLLPKYAGLRRCGKSCRLRWVNHLKPGVKRGSFSKEEEDLIIKLHTQLGNKWSAIAAKLPGRTDNDIKNFWHTRIARRQKHNSAASEASASTMELVAPKPTDDNYLYYSSQPSIPALTDAFEFGNEVSFPPLVEEEFRYPQVDSNMNNVQVWIADYKDEVEGGDFDPLFCFWN